MADGRGINKVVHLHIMEPHLARACVYGNANSHQVRMALVQRVY